MPGTIVGNLSWKFESLAPITQVNIIPPAESNVRSTALLLASQLGAALKHMGYSEVPDVILEAVRVGFTLAPRPTRIQTGPLRVSTLESSSSESTSLSPTMGTPPRTWDEALESSRG